MQLIQQPNQKEQKNYKQGPQKERAKTLIDLNKTGFFYSNSDSASSELRVLDKKIIK